MVARREKAAAALPKTGDSGAVCFGQTVARIDRKKPQLVEIRFVQAAQNRVVSVRIFFIDLNDETFS